MKFNKFLFGSTSAIPIINLPCILYTHLFSRLKISTNNYSHSRKQSKNNNTWSNNQEDVFIL